MAVAVAVAVAVATAEVLFGCGLKPACLMKVAGVTNVLQHHCCIIRIIAASLSCS